MQCRSKIASTMALLLSYSPYSRNSNNLSLENEVGTNLVGGLVDLLGIKGGTKTESYALAKEDIVACSCDAAVIDLELFLILANHLFSKAQNLTLAKETGSNRYLLATSRPTELLLLESQVALAPASVCELTLW